MVTDVLKRKKLDRILETKRGQELVALLLGNVVDVVFALQADAVNHERIGWTDRAKDLRALSERLCGLAGNDGFCDLTDDERGF